MKIVENQGKWKENLSKPKPKKDSPNAKKKIPKQFSTLRILLWFILKQQHTDFGRLQEVERAGLAFHTSRRLQSGSATRDATVQAPFGRIFEGFRAIC